MKKRFEVPYSAPRWWYAGGGVPACFGRTHFMGAVNSKIVCKAFPDGIPKELFLKDEFKGETAHTEPFPGDNGIQYEPYVNPNL